MAKTNTFTFTSAISEAIIALAKASRKTRETTQGIHEAYCNATLADEQKAIELTFRSLWIQGDTNVSADIAEMTLRAGKGANAVDAPAVMRSYRAFQYHIIRDDVTTEVATKAAAKSSDETAKAKASAATKAEAAAVAMFIQMVGSRKRALELLNTAK